MNVQKAIAVEKKGKGSLSLKEIFPTIQGEGPLVGKLSVFIRLGGCNILCEFCDTDYTTDLRKISVEAVVEEAVHLRGRSTLAVVTGGEPFRQYNLPGLVEQLLEHFKDVQIETNGTCFQSHFVEVMKEYGKDRISVVCSPKVLKLHPQLVPWITAYKVLIVMEYKPMVQLLRGTVSFEKWFKSKRGIDESVPIFVQPVDSSDLEQNARNVEAAIQCVKEYDLRLSLQMHKILGLP
jgi:organic radical activating enzyme